ncbi:class I SAM-dependent methyltransferase [Mucilaginibacter sp. ZT4R22]|uniref:Class I SAM-dependent methyltransferase n=1 Tax=Mucilaginibacter pankratovii TaxID=2772110 RepID=A0ABR7WRC1_9SPHI|nr:class I SAM-dependent methyltransferase [Mucilaginibacter pankratovii]MBD1364860.1 class I SAM-dependent methyltransferase [Mucilaginibacter pankratovii]
MSNLTFTKDFLFHRLTSKNRHGLHSPFVYKLVDEVIYDRKHKPAYDKIEKERDNLLIDDRVITVTDLGAGSRVNKSNQKKISDITINALKPPKLAQLLYRLAAFAKPRNIVELGTCLGITTLYLHEAAPDAKVYTLEGCPETAKVATEVFNSAGLQDVNLVTGNFDDTLAGVLGKHEKLDFVYIDGNHQRVATLNYFEQCLPKVHEGTMLIFDDIYWSEGMKQAWAQIKANPQVTVTVDLFWIGLVFFKTGRVKEDFKIRF